jgi:5-methylthioribose kinase
VIECNEQQQSTACGYRTLTADSVAAYLATRRGPAQRLGGSAADWRAVERGDGNLNLVFVVSGPAGALVVKQALPYVRMVGPNWPLSLTRSHYEASALIEQARWGPAFVPEVFDTDADMAVIVMQYLGSHRVLRKGLIAGCRYPLLGRHVGQFLAGVSFRTSDLHLSPADKRRRVAYYLGNVAMCKISEDLIFDEPYFSAPMNRHTVPGLDEVAEGLKGDLELKLAAQEMKWRFLTQAECLIHGDLHTGSVMVTEDDTRVIDPEFAIYGPMGFDLGLFIANLLIAFLSQRPPQQPGQAHTDQALQQIESLWQSFAAAFAEHWQPHAGGAAQGGAYNARLFVEAPALVASALRRRLADVWDQAVGFAGCEMIRRVVGLSHVEDFEGIADADVRARRERTVICLAREMLMQRADFDTAAAVVAAARRVCS